MNDTPTSDATASANPDDPIDWRGMGDIFSPSPVAHHDVATSHMDALAFIPHLDLDTADHHMVVSAIIPGMSVSPVPAAPDITTPSATQPAAIYVHIPDDGSPDEIEVAPIVTKLNTNNNNTGTSAAEDTTQPKDVVLHPAPEDIAVQQEVAQSGIVAAPEAQAPLAAATTPPVITKMEAGAATNDGGVLLLGDVPSVSVSMVKAQESNNTNINNMKNTPKRARGPGQTQVLVQQHNTSTTTMGVAKGRVDKASSSISLKEKREREAKQFPPELLLESGIGGTTSAEVRKMTPDERQLVHYKRKLRNRESARRSRQKRQATLTDIHEELGELMNATTVAMNTAQHLANRNKSLVKKLEVAQAELRALKTSIEKDNNNNSINEARKVGA